MRLSAELLGSAEQRPNPLSERELILRGLAIPAIEHLGVTRDAFDCIDFSDNRLSRLENFPRLLRLSSLMCSGNLIESVDPSNMKKNIPNIKYLTLSDNQISSLHEVSIIGKACPNVQFLFLNGNPVTRRQHYRLYTIHHIPSLKVLDFEKIKPAERDRAQRLANSAAGAALESDVQMEAAQRRRDTAVNGDAAAKTFVPGEGRSAKESFVTNFTPEQKELIRQMVSNAKSPAEIEEIEQSVKRGVLPNFPTTTTSSSTTPTESSAADTTSTILHENRKRPPDEENHSNSNGQDAKKNRVEE